MKNKPKALIYEMDWGDDITYFVFPPKWEIDEDPIIYDGMVLQDSTGWHPDVDEEPLGEFRTEDEAQEFINNL